MAHRYCTYCGTQRVDDAQFCQKCGAAFPAGTLMGGDKKELNKYVIDKDLHNQKNTVGAYIGQALLFVLMIVVAVIGNPAILICGIFWVLNVIRMIRDDAKRSALKYYVLERTCIDKKHVTDDDGPDRWQLWFENRDGSLYVATEVEKDFHDATELGDSFYVVFLQDDKTPCLCYRTTEWGY